MAPEPTSLSDVTGMLDTPLNGPTLVRGKDVLAEALRERLISTDTAFILRFACGKVCASSTLTQRIAT